jgi:hypothetical protein
MESEEKIETNTKMESETVRARRKLIETILQTPYQVHLKNIHQDALQPSIVHEHLLMVPSLRRGIAIGPCPRTAVMVFMYSDIEDAKKVVKEFSTSKDWQWNFGFKAKFNGLMTIYARENGTQIGGCMDHLGLKLPTFIGEGWDDSLEDFKRGCVVRLPSYNQRRVGALIDVRLERSQFGNPVLIVDRQGDLVNIVLVSSLL